MPPIHFLVLYYGTETAWSGAASLHEQWNADRNDPTLSGNESVCIVDLGAFSSQHIKQLTSDDFKAVVETVQYLRKGMNLQAMPDYKLQFPESTAWIIAALTGNTGIADQILDRIRKTNQEDITLQTIYHFASQADLEKAKAFERMYMEKVVQFVLAHGHPEWMQEYLHSGMDADAFIQSKIH